MHPTRTILSRAAWLGAALAAAACGSNRTVAATQPTGPQAFDAAGSDPKAVAIAEQVRAAAGGDAAWAAAKEIQWSQAIVQDGKLVELTRHSYDRWNGRHNYKGVEPDGTIKEAMYDVYERTGVGRAGGQQLMRDDANALKEEATRKLWSDSYFLFLAFKLRDPGVKVAYKGERAKEGETAPTWDVLRVSFDPAVGTDHYEISVNRQTHQIDIVEKVIKEGDKEKFLGYTVDVYQPAGALTLPTRFINLGFQKTGEQPIEIPGPWAEAAAALAGQQVGVPGEIFLYWGFKTSGTPNDDLYIPNVLGP